MQESKSWVIVFSLIALFSEANSLICYNGTNVTQLTTSRLSTYPYTQSCFTIVTVTPTSTFYTAGSAWGTKNTAFMQKTVENNVSVTYKHYYCNTDRCNGPSSLPTNYDVVSPKVLSCYEGYWNMSLTGKFNFSDWAIPVNSSAPNNLYCSIVHTTNVLTKTTEYEFFSSDLCVNVDNFIGVFNNDSLSLKMTCCNTNNCNSLAAALSKSDGLKFSISLIAINILSVLYFVSNN